MMALAAVMLASVIGSVIVPIVAILILVVLNGLFVAAEFSLVAARPSRLQTAAERGNKAAKWLLGVFERTAGKDGYIAVAQLGITLASIGLGMYGEPAVAHWIYGPLENLGVSEAAVHTIGFVFALSIITYFHVVFGEMIPKALALQAPETVSIRVNPLMRTLSVVFRPFVAILNSIAFALMRMLRIPEPDKSMSLHTSDELAIVADDAASGGQLGLLQRDLIRNIFELEDHTAEEIMVSRAKIVAVDVTASTDELASMVAASPRSRYPVIDGDLDHVVGMLHIKDFIRAAHGGADVAIEDLLRPLPTVAATVSAEDLLERFKDDSTHAALVIDEFGSTLGLVSLDDVIEEVLDDDAPDLGEDHADGSISFDGETTLADLEEHYGFKLDNDDVNTIAGLVLAIQGTVPPEGTVVDYRGFVLTVEAVSGAKITQVRLQPPDNPGGESTDDTTSNETASDAPGDETARDDTASDDARDGTDR